MLTNVIPQKSLTGESFATMFTNKRLCVNTNKKKDLTFRTSASWERLTDPHVSLTHRLGLPVEVVEQLGVAGEHAAAGRTGDQSLLSVAPDVFSQSVADLEESVAACRREKKRTSQERHSQSTSVWPLLAQSYLPSGRTEPVVVVRTTVTRHFGCDCPHVGRTTQGCWMNSVPRRKNVNSMIIMELKLICWWMKKLNHKYLHHSSPTGRRSPPILQEPGCCCVNPGCSWAGRGGTGAAGSPRTWAFRGSCESKRGPPAPWDFPSIETHILSRDKRTHLNREGRRSEC